MLYFMLCLSGAIYGAIFIPIFIIIILNIIFDIVWYIALVKIYEIYKIKKRNREIKNIIEWTKSL